MSDDKLRRLERKARGGDPEAHAKLRRERTRAWLCNMCGRRWIACLCTIVFGTDAVATGNSAVAIGQDAVAIYPEDEHDGKDDRESDPQTMAGP